MYLFDSVCNFSALDSEKYVNFDKVLHLQFQKIKFYYPLFHHQKAARGPFRDFYRFKILYTLGSWQF